MSEDEKNVVPEEPEKEIEEERKEDPKGETKKSLPLGIILDGAKDRIETVTLNEYYTNGIPASLLETVLEAVLAEVRRLKNQEYVKYINGGKE